MLSLYSPLFKNINSAGNDLNSHLIKVKDMTFNSDLEKQTEETMFSWTFYEIYDPQFDFDHLLMPSLAQKYRGIVLDTKSDFN